MQWRLQEWFPRCSPPCVSWPIKGMRETNLPPFDCTSTIQLLTDHAGSLEKLIPSVWHYKSLLSLDFKVPHHLQESDMRPWGSQTWPLISTTAPWDTCPWTPHTGSLTRGSPNKVQPAQERKKLIFVSSVWTFLGSTGTRWPIKMTCPLAAQTLGQHVFWSSWANIPKTISFWFSLRVFNISLIWNVNL